jgi:nitrogen fixation protein NifU and related proteins
VSDLRELYQSVILDHNRAPRNYGPLDGATSHAEGRNPLCGDDVTVWVKLEDGRIQDIRFAGAGCAISKASASLMTTVIKGHTPDEALAVVERFHAALTGGPNRASAIADDAELRRLAPLAGVSQFPERVKCATLAWHALRGALQDGTPPRQPVARQ